MTGTCPELTQDQRNALFDQLEQLPDSCGYTLKANRDCTYSLTISGNPGHAGMPRIFVRGAIGALIRDATDYLTLLRATGRMSAGKQMALEAAS